MAKKKSKLKGTQTERNLVIAYMAESAAYSRYTFYATRANKESYFPIEEVFTETAANELRHAKCSLSSCRAALSKYLSMWMPALSALPPKPRYRYPRGRSRGVEMYTNAAKVAEEEGFADIAEHFRSIAEIEESHRKRFVHYLEQVKAGTVWKRDHEITWKCLVCGYEYKGKTPPKNALHATTHTSTIWAWTTNNIPFSSQSIRIPARLRDAEASFFVILQGGNEWNYRA